MKAHLFLIAACFVASTTSQTLTDSSPNNWIFGSYQWDDGQRESTKAPVGQRVSKIQIYKGWSSGGDFGGIEVFYGTTPTSEDIAKYDEDPLYVSNTVFHTLTLTPTQRIIKVEAYRMVENSKNLLCKLVFFLNDNTQSATPIAGPGSCGFTAYTFDTPTSYEFAGFFIHDGTESSQITRLGVYYFGPCDFSTAITLDLSNINGKTKNLFDGADSVLSFAATDNTSIADGCPNLIKYDLDFSPESKTSDLIDLVSDTAKNVEFKASSDTDDAKVYTVVIRAKFDNQDSWLTSASATFTYVVPSCATATITATAFPSITTSVFVPASSSTALWYDSFSGSASSQDCGPFNVSVTFPTAPGSFDSATMSGDFTHTTSTTQATLTVSPTFQPQEVGSYVVRFQVCLTNHPTRCAQFDTSVTITACVVTAVQVVDQGSTTLSSEAFLLNGVSFQKSLVAKQTPNCGYASSGWIADSTGANTSHQDMFEVFTDATNGVLGWAGMTQSDRAGSYNVAITSVTVNGVTYNGSQLVQPSSFTLTVSTVCGLTVVTASTVSSITLTLGDADAEYPSAGVAYTDFTDTVSAASGDPTLCSKTYTASITGPATLTTFNLNAVTSKFQIYSNVYNQIGTYTVTLTGTVTDVPTISATTTFTITVNNPCPTTTLIQPTPALSDMSTSVLVASGPVTQQVGVFKDQVSVTFGDPSGTQYCSARQYSITSVISTLATASLDSASLSIDATSGLISVQSSNPAHIGTHTATVSVNLSSYTSITSTLATFTITIQPCAVTSVQVVQSPDLADLADQTYTLSSALTLSYHLAVKLTPSCGYTSSGWSVTASGPVPANFNTIDALTGTYSVGPTTTLSQSGIYTIQVTSVVVNGIIYATSPALVSPSSFTLTVLNPCAATIVTGSNVNAITLTVWDLEQFYPSTGSAFTDFTDSISTSNSNPTLCAKTYSATISTNTGGNSLTNFLFDTGLKQFKISSQNYNQIGTYTVTLKGAITDFPSQFAESIFTITVIDPCLATTLIQPTPVLNTMQTSVLVQVSPGGSPYFATQQVEIFKDQVSVVRGDASGTQYCGARQYSISSTTTASSLTAAELFIDSSTGLIKVYTARNAAIGIHQAIVTVNLASYLTITSTLSAFTIEIIGCVITGFSMVNLSPANDQTYTISDSAHTWSLVGSSVTTQVPPCGYAETVTSATTPPFVTATSGSTINYSAHSNDLAHVGTNTISVTSTLTGYNFNPARVAPTCSSTFVLTALDPCLSSAISIVPTTIENLVAFAGQNITSLLKYTFNDTQSFSRTLTTDPVDFCGEKLLKFSINSTTTKTLNAKNGDLIYFSPQANTTSFGVGTAIVVSSMKNYPSIESAPISFAVTILGSVVPYLEDKVYNVSSAPLLITYEPFRVLPNGYDAGSSTEEAYIFTGAQLPTQIDLTCTCLQKIDSLDWVQFDATASTMAISTSSNQNVGVYQIVLVKTFDRFADFNLYSHFSLTIQPLVLAPGIQQPPFFETSLEPQIVAQCPGPKTELWSFELPKYFDPNNSPVTVSVKLKSDFFAFDNSTMRITQKTFIEKSVNETFVVTLQNDINQKATYSMLVQFVCKVIPNITFNFTIKEQKERIAKQKQWPKAYIAVIEPNGLLRVKFNQKMKVPDHPEYIQNETITLDEEVYPILGLTVIPGNYSDPHMLAFNWTFIEFTPIELVIQLDFENQMYVSSHNKHPDQIQLTIFGYQLFADVYGNFMSPPTVLKPKILPALVSQSEAAAAQSVADSVQGAMQSAMLANTIVSLIISGPLQQLLDSVKQLQIIVHITLINVAYPATATMFMGMLMNVLTFQFYDFSDFYNKVFSLDPDSLGNTPLNNQFNMLGYNARYIIQNFGTLCWTIFVAPVGWAFAPILVSLCKGEFAYLKTRFNRMMFYNYWIGFINEGYLFLAVCAGLNLFYFKWSTYGDAINSLLALFCGSFLIIFPFFVGIFYRKQSNFNQILNRNEEFLSRFGSAIVGLNFKRRGKLALINTCASIVRKLSLAYIVVFWQSQPTFSIFVVNFQAILMMMTSGLTEPMTDRVANTMELVNEALVLLTTYHLYQFTEFMTFLDNRSLTGRSLMLLIIINVVLNIGVVVIQTSVLAIRKLKLKFMKHQKAQRIKKQLARKLEKQYWSAVRNKIRLKDAQVARRAERARLAELEASRHAQDDQLIRTRQKLPESDIENQLSIANLPRKVSGEQPLKSALKKKSNPTLHHNPRHHQEKSQTFKSALKKQPKYGLNQNTQIHTDKDPEDIIGQETRMISVKVKPETLLRNLWGGHDSKAVVPTQAEPPAVIKSKTLATHQSVMKDWKIEVQEVYQGGKTIKFTIQNDFEKQIVYPVSRFDNAQTINDTRERALKHARDLVIDFDQETKNDIDSGKFEEQLIAYEKQRRKYFQRGQMPRKEVFEDFGEYDPDSHLRDKIYLYHALLIKSRRV